MIEWFSIDVSVLFIALASYNNAVMDTCAHHYSSSIFNNGTAKSNRWYNAEISWKNKYVNYDKKQGRVKWSIFGFKFNKPVQLTDAWHFHKMLMIIFICCAIISHNTSDSFLRSLLQLLFYGFVWNITFSLFYDKLLIKHKI